MMTPTTSISKHFLDPKTVEILDRSDATEIATRVTSLLSEPVSREVRNTLVLAAAQLRVEDIEHPHRSALSKMLFARARDIVTGGIDSEREVSWAAIGMAARLLEPTGLSGLIDFLDGRLDSYVRQVALQSISLAAYQGPLPEIPELHDLRRAVEGTARSLCHVDLLGIWGVAPLAIESVVAAKALSLTLDEAWIDAFRSRPLLLAQLEEALGDVSEWWPREGVRTGEPVPPRPDPEPSLTAPYRRPRVHIGQEFVDPTSGHLIRVTDVGLRTLIFIDITRALAEGYKPDELHGPPYSVREEVWSEYDLAAPWSPAGIQWDDVPLTDPCPALHSHSFNYQDGNGACYACGKTPDLTGKCLVCKGKAKVMGDCGESPNVWYDPCSACDGTGNAPVAKGTNDEVP